MQPAAAAGHARTGSSASIDALDTTVRVALRARPLVARERLDGAKVINMQMLNHTLLLVASISLCCTSPTCAQHASM
jgi:hypothetical protein